MGTVGSLALSIGLVLVGGIIGLLIGRRVRRPSARDRSVVTIAELLSRLIGSARNGVVVLNRFGDVVFHNERAVDLGVVRAKVPDSRARAAAEQALAENRPLAVDLSEPTNRGRAPRAVAAEVRPLGDGFIVVDAVDESEAVRLESTRRDFVANVSHELKTPVGALALLAEAILDAAGEPEQVRRFSGKILHEATRLGTLVTELIALSRLQGAERLPELTALDVEDLVQEALGRCRLAAESAGIEVTTDEDAGLEVDGDRMLLVTALSNLIDNAISYSPKGSPVSVSRRLVAGYVEISVTDRGIGIDPEFQQRVFERFFRVDQARSRATGGTGLGLAIVKHVAANHGGSVRLWSSPGTGSTFTLSVPAKVVPKQVSAEQSAASGAQTTGVAAAEVGSAAIGSAGEIRSTAVQHEGVQ
ncbi:two-component system sensor histidine kinase SenX3 [Actinoalloteichus hoggarensis]|uniref:Sensor-like histidine kinase SenX3 n=1 Tax=Actinoalloteichus hoggarensis TaxID=1470176 RepID=A0A221VXW9_9PSEU|nr:ATP-binding protein [Actinoalloteichus hoggarensis]ASO18101.1 Signal-transduction histidine kinase senX3 [Actinoalloteichus hoggarensis]MBB5921458.1 two-component system sensor histidine kinase SenX3 [Actinoalloteichus hoggarensis]